MSSSLNRYFVCFFLVYLLLASSLSHAESPVKKDLVILGASPAGISAGIAARRNGLSVVVLESSIVPGGMMSGGLGFTDTCRKEFIGGLALEFFQRIGREHGKEIQWNLVPSVAEKVFREWIEEEEVEVLYGIELRDVKLSNGYIQSVLTADNREFAGRTFIDASYTGDLLAAADVEYTIGRESRERYGESLAGFTLRHKREQFPVNLSAFDENEELYFGVSNEPLKLPGVSDSRVMAYNFRPCLTKNRSNIRKFYKPETYDPKKYALLLSLLKAAPELRAGDILGINPTIDGKFDLNNKGPFSTNLLGLQTDYSTASKKERVTIEKLHAEYIQGLLFFLSSDPQVPDYIRDEVSGYGYCADEFVDNENFPSQLYVRVGRRMIGRHVLVEQDLVSGAGQPDSVAWGSCRIEVHHNQRLVDESGHVFNEGVVPFFIPPYQIPFRSLLPKEGQADNLLVPVAISASNVAYSSLRMEPGFMALGEAAGIAAALASKYGLSVNVLESGLLRAHLSVVGAKPGGRYGKYDKLFIYLAFTSSFFIMSLLFCDKIRAGIRRKLFSKKTSIK